MGDASLKSAQEISSIGKLEKPPNTGDPQRAQPHTSDVIRALTLWRSPRLAELDAQIRAEAERHQNRCQKLKPRRRSNPLPPAVHKEVTRLAQELTRDHSQHFINDPELKDRVARWFRSLLPPWGHRGGRGYNDVTVAIELLDGFRRGYSRLYPDEKPHQIGKRVWGRICPQVISNYGAMSTQEQRDAREELRGRVRDRLNKRKRSARPELALPNPPSVSPSQFV